MSNPVFHPVVHQGIQIQVCCISFNSHDCIRLIGVPQNVANELRSAITSSWGKIKKDRPYHGGYEFQVKGAPWLGNGDDAVRSRKLLVALLKCMAQNGWNLMQSTDTSKKAQDKDAIYFEVTQPDPEARLFALSFNRGDRIRLIGAPESMNHVLKQAVLKQTVIRKEKDYYGAFEIKLPGEPWWSQGASGIATKTLLCQILADFRAAGFKLYSSVDISYGTEGHDLETWVFRAVSPPFWQ